MRFMKKLYLRRFTKPIVVFFLSVLALLVGFKVIYAETSIISINKLFQNQNVVYDVEFVDEQAIGQIKAPVVDYGGFFNKSTISYNVEGIKPNDQNIAYFVYPLLNLEANSKYNLKLNFDFSSDATNTQELLISSTNQPVSQGPQIDKPNQFATNIDPTKLEAKQYYVQSGLRHYQHNFEIQTNKEGQCFLLIGIKMGKNDHLQFNIGNMSMKLQPMSDDNI